LAAPKLNDYADEDGRKRAWRELVWKDHGFIRALYDNTHVVAPGKVWRTYQPGPAKLRNWKKLGIKTVVNLRGPKPSGPLFLETEACREYGLALVNFRVFSREAPSPEILHGAQKLFRDIEYPAIFHCKSGADRVGLMSALYLFFEAGEPIDKALRHLSLRYGHVRQGKTGVIDHAFDAYLVHAAKNEIALDDVDAFFYWVDTDYDHIALKRDFKANWWGTLLTEKILRRE
jgi:protein tyrosine/serine phosphatase